MSAIAPALPRIDVQFRRVPGGFAATCGTKTATSFRSALYAARAAAAAFFGVSEGRIEIEVEGPCITASVKPATGGAA
jgi:sarcosine oxidase gamma subunit